MLEPPKDLDPSHRAEGHMELRYEDVTQDGFLRTVAMAPALGKTFWAPVASRLFAPLRGTGIVPILSRLHCESGDGPIGLAAGVRAESRYALATVGAGDDVERILLCVWLSLFAPRARVYGPPPPGEGEELAVGRVFAEHVFTRPFAPPGERRVLALDAPPLPQVPARRVPRVEPVALLALPEGAAWTSGWALDPAPVVFGVDHTDANQHVNSLVYPQLFRDAALRAWRGVGIEAPIRVVADATSFRKPAFAADALAVAVRTFERHGRLGAAVAIATEDVACAICESSQIDRLTGKYAHACARLEALAAERSAGG